MLDLDFELLRTPENHETVGIRVGSDFSTEGNNFCQTFPQHLADGSAQISVDQDDMVHLVHPQEGEFKAKLQPKDAAALSHILEDDTKEMQITRKTTWGGGFSIYPKASEEASLEGLKLPKA